ncbi:hypothetical protein T439DRAFT_176471 [Meredithblackwellia eburnea MCA 4105]
MSLSDLLHNPQQSTSSSLDSAPSNGTTPTSIPPAPPTVTLAAPDLPPRATAQDVADVKVKSKKKKPSPAQPPPPPPVSTKEDVDSQGRRSLRRSARPSRFGDLYEDQEALVASGITTNYPIRNGEPTSEPAPGEQEDDAPSDEEGGGLLRATAHIWREPLESYILTLHAKKQKLQSDFEKSEQSRLFTTAARVVDMSDRRIGEMQQLKQVRFAQREQEAQNRVKAEMEAQTLLEIAEQKKVAKAQDKDERLRKQREAAKRRRDEERAKKVQGDDEARRLRAEKERLARLAEAERRSLLTPEEREAEDRERAREAELQRMRDLEDDLLGAAEGRSAKKKRRTDHWDGNDEFDELMDDDELNPRLPSKLKGKGSRKSSVGPGAYEPYAIDAHGHPLSYPHPFSHTGAYSDPHGNSLHYPSSIPGYGSPNPRGQSPYASSTGAPYSDAGFPDDELDESKANRSLKTPGQKKPKTIEEQERKIWTQIARKDIPKVNRVVQQSVTSRQFFSKRLSTIVAREARRGHTRTKGPKDAQIRAKKVMREMMVFMKGNEKRERESRKKAEKEALDKAKKEEDVREAKRQARKLNFLITQTELYSHFVGSKIKTKEAEESEDTASDAVLAAPPQQSASLAAAIAAGDSTGELKELNFDEDDESNAAQHARRNAQAAVDAAKNAAAAFDAAAAAGSSAPPPKKNDGLDFADEMDFQNPSGMKGDVQVGQPKLLTCTLKEYQLKGLNWLANLYEQGINGILADEMGLGKTVQSISLMAYLAEVHNIWGPFLVIAPASTLHNWQQEITRFVPALKALPYWGNTKDRAVLRKFWNRKSLRYDKDAPFHILVTSYQLVVQDEKYFQGVKWQYMVLDEAQAIKSSSSTRWKTLLGFRCRNRLLLTGTPIQNSMHELWALLHFIMPSLFDSHDEFSEWFSKDIENNAENKGAMNEHQLRRLHMILKPFMLRRIKKNVQNELGDKIEIDLFCDLTPRQKGMYRTLRENISITDLVSRATSLNDDDSVKRLMNLIMQFRKVCNHPELFERADVTAPLAFSSFNATANIIRDPEVLEVPYIPTSVIQYRIPKLLYRDGGMLSVPGENCSAGSDTLYLENLMNIWTPSYIQKSLKEQNSSFSFTRGMDLSATETSAATRSHAMIRAGLGLERANRALARQEAETLGVLDSNSLSFQIPAKSTSLPFDPSWRKIGLIPLSEVEKSYRLTSRLSKQDARFFMDNAVSPAIEAVCSDRSFVYDQQRERFDPIFSSSLFGIPDTPKVSRSDISRFETSMAGLPAKGVLAASTPSQLPFPPMKVPQLRMLILDSGKLAKLDNLLHELKAGGHRVLIYFQMTKMIDLMEEYLAFRQYKYLRLDGSSTISERRDMVMDWQTKPELFIFLLSTRAGGLGINLTAADTVIFYDSDWNPSNDAQAMDRAHRLGQTKQVTVYRLITKDTVDERIVQLARNKKLVQDAVVGSSSIGHTESTQTKTTEVVSLLLGEDELEESIRQAELKRQRASEKQIADGQKGAARREDNKAKRLEEAAKKKGQEFGTSWVDDDDDGFSFFDTSNPNANNADDDDGQPSGTGAETPQPKKKGPKKRKNADEGEGAPKAKKPRAKKGANL